MVPLLRAHLSVPVLLICLCYTLTSPLRRAFLGPPHPQVVGETSDHDIDLSDLDARLSRLGDRAALVSVTHVPTSSGRVYDAAGVGRVTRAHGMPYLLDACQSVGQMPIDVAEIGCDFLTGTSRKYLRGPRCAWVYPRQRWADVSLQHAQ